MPLQFAAIKYYTQPQGLLYATKKACTSLIPPLT